MERKALGKGLEALFQNDVEQNEQQNYKEVSISLIRLNPDQPRKSFDLADLTEMADSIRTKGVIQPILVKQQGVDEYQIIAGERRFRAAKLAGLDTVPIIIKNFEEQEIFEISLLENIQRKDLNPIEEAQAYAKLMSLNGHRQEDLAKRLGKSRPYVANSLRLLQLNSQLQELLVQGSLSVGHARVLLAIEDPQAQMQLAQKTIAEGASVRTLEGWVQDWQKLTKKNVEKKTSSITHHWPNQQDLEKQLTNLFKTNVKIEVNTQNKGWIKMQIHDIENFNELFELLTSLKKS